MRLNKLTLQNFQGIKNLELNLNGEDIAIYGDNATGKTTIFNAFCWLMFDKNSLGQAQFDIKTLDEKGNPLHGLDHSVEAEFDDGLKLKKVYKEKWTKQRGSTEAVFSGHTVDYYIDDIPAKKSEYTDKISLICNEDLFKLFSNPLYFNTQMKWQDRRDILFKVCGNVTDEEVINSNKALVELNEILSKRTLEQHKKLVASKLTEINKELNSIPLRIDEVSRGLEDEASLDAKVLAQTIKDAEGEIVRQKAYLNLLESDVKIGIQKDIAEHESKMTQYCTELQKGYNAQLEDINTQIIKLKKELALKETELYGYRRIITGLDKDIEDREERMEKLREVFAQEYAKTFEFKESDTCPTCKQSLPVEQIKDTKARTLARFNQDKAEKLENIRTQGKALAKENESDKVKLEQNKAKETTIAKAITGIEADIEVLKLKLPKPAKPLEDEGYRKMVVELDELKKKLQTPDSNQEKKDEIRACILKLESDITNAQKSLNIINSNEKGRIRIDELTEQQQKIADEHREYSKQLHLCEEFTKTKSNMVTDRINSNFKMAEFKLFDVQVNGGINEVCEVTYKGVPFQSLNNAGRINVGLDIINTLSKHYSIEVPVFVDNAESVTDVYELDAQMIKLVVDGDYKKLNYPRVENGEE